MLTKFAKFEDYAKSIEDEDFLDNSRKTPFAPGSYKNTKALKLKEDGKLKSKKKRINVLPHGDTLGISTKDATMILGKK
jgi:hypothetical protein